MKLLKNTDPRVLFFISTAFISVGLCSSTILFHPFHGFAEPIKDQDDQTLGALEKQDHARGRLKPRLPSVGVKRDAAPHQQVKKGTSVDLASKKLVTKRITLASQGEEDRITIATGAPGTPLKVRRLSSPDRLVIDVRDAHIPRSAAISNRTALVRSIRVGAHPDKSRIVVDLENSAIEHNITQLGDKIFVALKPKKEDMKSVAKMADRSSQDVQAGKKVSVVSRAAPVRSTLTLDEAILVSGDSADSKKENQVRAMPKRVTSVEVEKSERVPLALPAGLKNREETSKKGGSEKQDTRVRLEKLVLKGQAETSPTIELVLPNSVIYKLDRTAPSEYVATLFNVKATSRIVKQAIFASSKSTGIRSVRVAQNGNDTLIRIFIQPSSYLTSKWNNDALIIEESHDLAQIARDIRAQIAPAAVDQKAQAKTLKDASKDKTKEPKNDPKSAKLPPTAPDKKVAKKVEDKGKKKEQEQKRDAKSELAAIRGDSPTYTGRLISLDLQDADIDSALRIIAEVSNLNIVAGDGVSGKVTLKLVDVPWDQALEVILKSQGLDKVLKGNVLRVAPVDKLREERESFKEAQVAEEELEPLSVQYIRVSYAKASEITALVETVLSERGAVAFDERSNQLVVKDVSKGLKNVTELIKKIDLRTPQILLETQIVEASRSLSRELGSELGFQYIQSPATGNGTGLNFPSAISVGGSADTTGGGITGSAFPIASSASLGSAITMLFDSADGTKSLSARLSQLEQEGEVRIISKPAVATTNNKPAEIKSVEKFRVKLPNGGLSIATGSGAQSAGSGDSATQTIEAGIVLNVTPQASPDYYILLDIKAKSSSFGAKSVDGIPNEIERSASSSVLVSSGQTFALGGIYKITEQDRIAGVPFFKDIPVLGTFFRSVTTENADEELLFFITPRIVEGSFEDVSVKIVS